MSLYRIENLTKMEGVKLALYAENICMSPDLNSFCDKGRFVSNTLTVEVWNYGDIDLINSRLEELRS